MRKFVFTAAVLAGFSASTVMAGGLDEPVMEPEIIIEETSSSGSHDFVVPLLLLAVIAAVVSD